MLCTHQHPWHLLATDNRRLPPNSSSFVDFVTFAGGFEGPSHRGKDYY
jgi:hypothetical protein